MTSTDSDEPLSPEASAFVDAAIDEFNAKQDALLKNWRFDSYKMWQYDQVSGILKLTFADGAEFQADGQILGSYWQDDGSWEWAWNNPNVERAISRDSRLVKQLGQRLGISYLIAGKVPVPAEEQVPYLCALGIKATGSIGAFAGPADPVVIWIALKNPRWAKRP